MTKHAASTYQLFIASDHAGFELKELLKSKINWVQWIDLGPNNGDRVDYPDYADLVAREVTKSNGRGVLVCGSGQGMAIRANRYKSIRAALAWNEESIRLAREHNDANILCFGARMMSAITAERLIELFLNTPFEGGRHQARVDKLSNPTD